VSEVFSIITNCKMGTEPDILQYFDFLIEVPEKTGLCPHFLLGVLAGAVEEGKSWGRGVGGGVRGMKGGVVESVSGLGWAAP
jgi:hypothetical protein